MLFLLAIICPPLAVLVAGGPSRAAANLVDEPVVEDTAARLAGPPATRRARHLANRIYAMLTEAIDRRWRWDRFPTPVSLALIKGIRDNLREHNLFDTNDAASTPALPPEPPARSLVARSADGSYNDLSAPAGHGYGRDPVRAQREQCLKPVDEQDHGGVVPSRSS